MSDENISSFFSHLSVHCSVAWLFNATDISWPAVNGLGESEPIRTKDNGKCQFKLISVSCVWINSVIAHGTFDTIFSSLVLRTQGSVLSLPASSFGSRSSSSLFVQFSFDFTQSISRWSSSLEIRLHSRWAGSREHENYLLQFAATPLRAVYPAPFQCISRALTRIWPAPLSL